MSIGKTAGQLPVGASQVSSDENDGPAPFGALMSQRVSV
jgi:hypothetical protein